jgi:hypothetical protein
LLVIAILDPNVDSPERQTRRQFITFFVVVDDSYLHVLGLYRHSTEEFVKPSAIQICHP